MAAYIHGAHALSTEFGKSEGTQSLESGVTSGEFFDLKVPWDFFGGITYEAREATCKK